MRENLVKNVMRMMSVFVLLVASACSQDESDTGSTTDPMSTDNDLGIASDSGQESDAMMDAMSAPSLSIQPMEFIIPMLGAGERVIRTVTLSNEGSTAVEITQVTLDVTDGSAALSYGPRQLVGITPGGMDSFNYPVVIEAGETLDMAVEYTLGESEPGGQVTLAGNFSDTSLVLPIRALASVGQVSLNEEDIDFGRVRERTRSQPGTLSSPTSVKLH